MSHWNSLTHVCLQFRHRRPPLLSQMVLRTTKGDCVCIWGHVWFIFGINSLFHASVLRCVYSRVCTWMQACIFFFFFFRNPLQRAFVLIIHLCIFCDEKNTAGPLVSTTQYGPEMLIREQDRDLHSVWSGPLCCVYAEFFITNQRRRKRKVFIALIISLSDSYRTRGDGENRSREERERERRRRRLSCIWKVLNWETTKGACCYLVFAGHKGRTSKTRSCKVLSMNHTNGDEARGLERSLSVGCM